MLCKKINLTNFRNIESAELEFSDGVNVLVGNNAEGKTNLLEAVYLFALGKSFRGAKETDMIKFGEDFAVASLDFTENSRSDVQNLTMRMSRTRHRTVELNRVKVTRLSDMIGKFRAVLFCPEHLSLIKEGPAMRRNYLDVAISQFRPVYLKSLQRYYNILDQRNKLIKNAEEDRRTLDATIGLWNEQLAYEAAVISSFRAKYINMVGETVSRCFFDMSGDFEKTEIIYVGSSKQPYEEYFDAETTRKKYLSLFESYLEREISAGTTLHGIHKDDIEININGKSARLFGSQGQQRSLALAMKLAEGDICFKETGDRPVLLLDDVLSELDEKRRAYLLSSVRDRQVIITTCEKTDFGDVKKIAVEGGKYKEI